MDADRFDALLRSLSTTPTRRRVAHLLSGTVLAGLPTPGAMPADAKKGSNGKGKAKGKGRKKEKKCKGKERVTICHNGQTISISSCALKGHQKHGDTIGACDTPNPPTGCTGGTEPCGDQCVPPCGSGSVRDLATCGCCFETGIICDESGNTPCCNSDQQCRDQVGQDAVCCLPAEASCAGIDDTSCCEPLFCEENLGVFRCGI
jgi:hypothetical protein